MVDRIITLLNENDCSYTTFEHEAVRTSEEAALVRPEYTLGQGAKALIVRVKMRGETAGQKQFAQIVVPGNVKFDAKKVREVLNAKDIRFATEEEVDKVTGGIEPGGVPPFGNLFEIPVYVDETLLQHDEIIFNAGDRRFSIALKTKEYLKVARPNIASLV